MRSKRRGCPGLVAGVGLAALPVAARAAEVAFAIPEQPREAALMALGRQAGLSLGFAPGARCAGRAGVMGRMDVDSALARLLADTTCVAMRPDARTIVIQSRPRLPARLLRLRPPEEPAPPRATQLGEVVVTAGKIEQLLSAAPYGLSAVSGGELERAGVADEQDLSLLAAGVTVTNLGPGRDKVLLRGLSDGPLTGHTQSTVSLYLGDLRLTYNAPDPDLPLIDVERVEVLRGPQGTLYGAGSVGGILQIIPNAPDAAHRGGRLTAGASATEDGAGSYALSGVLNQPLGRTAGLRVVAWTDQDGGYIDNPRRGAKDIDRSRRTGVRAAVRWQPTSDLALDAAVVDQSITTRDAHYADVTVGPLARATRLREPHDNDFLAVSLAARWSPDWGRLTVNLGALDHDVGTIYDAAAAPMALVPAGAHPKSLADENHIRALVGEARLQSIGPSRFHWTLGGFASVGHQRLFGTITTIEAVPAYDEARRDQLLETAAFGEVSYDLTRDVTLTAGGRVYDSRLKTRSTVTLDGPLRDFRAHSKQRGFAPRVMLAWRPLAEVTTYVQASEGYRTAGFNTGGPAGQAFSEPGGPQPLRRYAGDELWSYEAGLRWQAPELGVSFRAAGFYAVWTDIQADLILPSGLPFTANLGDGHSRGVEAEATYALGGLRLSANIVRQDPELRKSAPGLATRPDSGLPGMPRLTFAGTLGYGFQVAKGWDLDLAASYAWVGHSRLAFDAATDPAMGDYSDIRLAADLSHGDLGVRLYVDNLLDRKGDTLAFGNPFTFRRREQTTPQRPRTFGVQVRRAF